MFMCIIVLETAVSVLYSVIRCLCNIPYFLCVLPHVIAAVMYNAVFFCVLPCEIAASAQDKCSMNTLFSIGTSSKRCLCQDIHLHVKNDDVICDISRRTMTRGIY